MENELDGYGNPIGSPWTPEREEEALSRKLKRLVRYDNAGEYCCDMQPFEDGDWVKFEDVKAFLANNGLRM